MKPLLIAIGVVIVLIAVTNPELRALVLLADAMGIEVLFLFLITQFRIWLPVIQSGMLNFVGRAVTVARWAARAMRYVGLGLIPYRTLVGSVRTVVYMRLRFQLLVQSVA